jgi:hypothetical protein
LEIDGPATLVLVEFPQPVTAASTARPVAKRGLTMRAGRVGHTIGNRDQASSMQLPGLYGIRLKRKSV